MAMSKKMATTKSLLQTVGSVAAAAMVTRSIVNDFLPDEVRNYIHSYISSIFNHRFSSETTMIIDEFDGLENNQIFEAAELYIGNHTRNLSSSSSNSAQRLKVRKPESEKAIQVFVDRDEEIVDEFEGVKFKWVLQCYRVESKNFYNPRDMNSTMRSETCCFNLTFHKKYKDMTLEKYLPHILKEADLLKQEARTIKLYTVDPNKLYGSPAGAWSSINLNHPATFDTLAMDTKLKKTVMDDLDRFLSRKEYYRQVGKAWKRGYLLYGPPGTGKSSLIAVMANYLKFNIYDLELGALRCDSDLRKLLVGTANRSIIVVEDIDCSIDLKDREAEDTDDSPRDRYHPGKITLSGLLNFIDGLWSSCGDERIIVFTTNHRDKIDPALLRPGRMDMHIHMSYCTPCGFNILARNYLGLQHHKLFEDIERLIEETKVTPAEVAEQLMKHDKIDSSLTGLLDFLKSANAEAKSKELETESQPHTNTDAKLEDLQQKVIEGEEVKELVKQEANGEN